MVCLVASLGTILKRTLSDGETRPILDVSDKALEIRELLRFRKPFYERAADITVNTSKLGIGSVAEQIISKLKENESFGF